MIPGREIVPSIDTLARRLTVDFEVGKQAREQPKVELAGDRQTKRAVAIETRRTADLEIGVGTVEMRLIDADLVAVIGQADVLIVRQAERTRSRMKFA